MPETSIAAGLRPNVVAMIATFTTRELRRIANSSTTAGRWNWQEINLANKLLAERAA